MPIDWFTVIAQAINFLILVAILRKFLYGPIVSAMEEREERIRARFDEAEEARDKAAEERERLAEKREELESREEEILDDARSEAREERKKMIEEARSEADHRAESWRRSLRQRSDQLVDAVTDRTAGQIVDAIERALQELADADLRDRAVDAFLRRVKDLDEEERAELFGSGERADDGRTVSVLSAHDLSEEHRDRIREVLEAAQADAVEFETDPDLIAGVEVRIGGRRVAWTLRGFVSDLEQSIREQIEEHSRRGDSADRSEDEDADSGSEAEGSEGDKDAETDESEPETAGKGASHGG